MTIRNRATLGRVVDDLGSTLLEVLAGMVEADRPVSGVVIHDPLDPPPLTPDTIVLGVGLREPDEIAALLLQGGMAALVVRVSAAVDDAVRAAAERSGVPLLGLTRGASWAQVSALLRSLLAVDDVGGNGDAEMLAGVPAGDLFALANAIAALLDAPVTIEDRSSRVLAFSGRQDEADSSRIETVLGRQVPERFLQILEKRGVFRELYGSDHPIHIDDIPGTELSRAAVRVRAGDEILGSIWAAIAVPLTAERNQALADASKLVALHLLRIRAGADVERRLRSDLLASLLEGAPSAGDAASRLGLSNGPLCVLALGMRADAGGSLAPQTEAEFQRVCGALSLHLSAVHPRAAAAPVGGVLYGVLPVGSTGDATRVVSVAGEFLDRIGSRNPAVVGVGRVVDDHAGLPRSRRDADRALRVLRTGRVRTRVAQSSDVHVDALLLELGDLLAREGNEVTGPVARLADYDRRHRSDMVATLRAWLDAFGDVNQAAATVHVHPNTFRYRLRRLATVGGMDLADPEARFAAMLQLRLSVHEEPDPR